MVLFREKALILPTRRYNNRKIDKMMTVITISDPKGFDKPLCQVNICGL